MRKLLLTSSMLAVAATATPVSAQSAQGAEEGSAANEIIVTARKREESLIDVPLPVTVATAEQLERDQVRTISDLQRVTPALEISQTSGGEVNGGARLRGLGTGVFNATVSPSVAFVVDQVAQGNVTFPVLFDMAQVEVLRGPQGTLFGQGASAGVINISTVAPALGKTKFTGGINYADKGTVGSEVGELTTRGAVNVPLGENAAFRFAGQYKREKGLQRNTFLGLDNKIQEYGLRSRLLFEPTDALKINLIGEYSKQTTRGWNFFAIAIAPNSTAPFDPDGPGPAPALGPLGPISTGNFQSPTGCNIPRITERAEFYCEETPARFRNTASNISGIIDYDVSDKLTLTSVTSFRTLDRKTFVVNFSRRVGSPAARNENIDSKSKQFSEEVRLAYEGEGLDLVAGAYYGRFKLDTTPINNNLPFVNTTPGQRNGFSVCVFNAPACIFVPNPFNPAAPPFVDLRPHFGFEFTKNRTFALFTDATVEVADQVDLFGGLRYSTYSNTTITQRDAEPARAPQKVKDNDISGRIGLSYKPSTSSNVYASYSRGYKPPAIVVPTIAADPVTRLKPETADALELGAKANAGGIQLSGNIFYTKVKNFQLQTSNFNSAGALVSVAQNISRVTSKGFEIGAFGRISDQFSINAGYQYNIVKYPSVFTGDDGRPLGGTQFLNAPKSKFTLAGEFEQPVSDSLEVFLNGNLVLKSKTLLVQRGDPRARYKGHELINLSFGLRDSDSKWSASVFARNLTKSREPTAYLASDFAGNSDGGLRAWPLAGLTARVVGVSLDFNF